MRSRSLPPGVLRRGWGAALTPARDHSPHDPLAPASLPPAATPSPDEEASPELWKTLRGRFVSKSETKEPNHLSLSHTNRGIMRFCQAYSAPATALVTDLDTPHRPKALCTSGTT